jgi:hypothetical protein
VAGLRSRGESWRWNSDWPLRGGPGRVALVQERCDKRPAHACALVSCALALGLGCHSQAPTEAAADAPAVRSDRAALPAPKAAPPGPLSDVSLRASGARSFRPTTGLLDLEPDRRLSRADFNALRLHPLSPVAIEARARGTLLLVLDEQSPRPLLENGATLRSVVDEDQELAPGWHSLVAFISSPAEVAIEQRYFQIELDLPRARQASGCVLLEPAGTVFLPPGRTVELMAAPLAPGVAQFEYYVASEPTARFRVPALEAAQAVGLASGDHRFGVRCYDQHSALVGQSERVVAVNADP